MDDLDDELEAESIMDIYFFANACHVCRAYGKGVELKRCSKCKSIAYCCREHQKKHWPRHKLLCRVLSEIVECAGTIFGIHRNWENQEEAWRKMKTNLVLLIQIKLGRKFLPFEREMLQFPRSCEICHETDPSKLKDCTDCPDASFCSKHPKDNRHLAKCEKSRLCFETSIEWLPFGQPQFAQNCKRTIPINMEQVICLHESVYRYLESYGSKKLFNVILSNQLSRPYTFLYSLQKLACPALPKMTIHVVGSTLNEMETVADWESLFHHNETLQELRIIFVGPDMWNCPPYEIKLCQQCKGNNRKLRTQSIQGLYGDFDENYLVNIEYKNPDYIIGYNLGIHECIAMENNTWNVTIQRMANLGCPFSFTSYTAEESTADQDRINSVLGKKVQVLWVGKNQFPGWKPYKDFESGDYFYQNKYLTVYEKLS